MNLRAGLLAVGVVAVSLWLGCSSNNNGPLEPPPGVVQEKPAQKPAAPRDANSTAPGGLFHNASDKLEDPSAPVPVERKARATGPFILDPLLD